MRLERGSCSVTILESQQHYDGAVIGQIFGDRGNVTPEPASREVRGPISLAETGRIQSSNLLPIPYSCTCALYIHIQSRLSLWLPLDVYYACYVSFTKVRKWAYGTVHFKFSNAEPTISFLSEPAPFASKRIISYEP